MAIRLAIIFVALFVQACTTPYKPPVIEPGDMALPGLLVDDSSWRDANLITIHGMCHHSSKWFKQSVKTIADGLDGSVSEIRDLDPGGQLTAEVYSIDVLHHRVRLRVYGILYSQITLPLKERLCEDVTKETDVCPGTPGRKRARLNGDFKNELLNNCIADAIIYLGDGGATIRDQVERALLLILSDIDSSSDAPLAYLSESLGSKVLGDTLVCSESDLRTRFAGTRPSHFFMAANQVPLLNLGFRGPGCSPPVGPEDGPEDNPQAGGIEAVFSALFDTQAVLGIDQNVSIVAFTDPNDLLSWELREGEYRGDIDLANVIVSNANTYLWLLENPYPAHRGYRTNQDVLNIMWCGVEQGAPASCPD